jgi:hypothetical protein
MFASRRVTLNACALALQVRVDFGRKRASFYTKTDGRLKIHPGSVNALNNHLMQR